MMTAIAVLIQKASIHSMRMMKFQKSLIVGLHWHQQVPTLWHGWSWRRPPIHPLGIGIDFDFPDRLHRSPLTNDRPIRGPNVPLHIFWMAVDRCVLPQLFTHRRPPSQLRSVQVPWVHG